jgi:pSer/pThr/pTyr-binding forkhead associated (FHA) protein
MVWLQTDEGIFKELPENEVVSIGRSQECDVFVDWKSISKIHAKLHVQRMTNKRLEVFIEDNESRNSTFVGHTPFDMMKVSGLTKLSDGDYIQFGNNKKYYRYFESLPSLIVADAETVLPIEIKQPINVPVESQSNQKFGVSSDRLNSQVIEHDDEEIGEELTIIPTRTFQSEKPRDLNESSYKETSKPKQDPTVITISYPTGAENVNPISIHIDSNSKKPLSSDSQVGKLMSSGEWKHKQTQDDVNSKSLRGDTGIEDEHLQQTNNILPPSYSEGLLEDNNVGNLGNTGAFKLLTSLKPLSANRTQTTKFELPKQSHSSPFVSKEFNRNDTRMGESGRNRTQELHSMKLSAYRRKYRGEFDLVDFDQDDVEYFVLEILGKEINGRTSSLRQPLELSEDYGWEDVEQVARFRPSPSQLASSQQKSHRGRNKITPDDLHFQIPDPIPPSLLSEALADLLLGPTKSVVGKLNASISAMNDLFEQMQHGACIDYTQDIVSKELDDALQSLALGFVDTAIANLSPTLKNSFIQAIDSAAESYNSILLSDILSISFESLERLKQFHLGLFPSRTKTSQLNQTEKCLVSYIALDSILEYVDSCNLYASSIYECAETRVSVHSLSFSKPITSEIESYRMMKSQSDLPMSNLILSREMKASDTIAEAMKKILHSAYGKSVLSRLVGPQMSF